MFAVPEHTVLSAPSSRPLIPTALVRAVAARPDLTPGPVPIDEPMADVWVSLLPPGVRAVAAYDAAQGAFAVLDGVVTELARGRALSLRPGQVRVFGPGYHHEVHNPGPVAALALHVQLHLGGR